MADKEILAANEQANEAAANGAPQEGRRKKSATYRLPTRC